MSKGNVYEQVVTRSLQVLHEDLPGIFHSTYQFDNFYFTNELDLFAITDPEKGALIPDCGDPRLVGTEHLDRIVSDLGISWDKMAVYITHFHDDHDGNVPYALSKGAKAIYVGPYVPYRQEDMEEWLVTCGAAERDDQGIRGETAYLMGSLPPDADYLAHATVLQEGQKLTYGDYTFQVLKTPGHTGDHTCLIDHDHGLLFAGDHLLDSAPGLMSYYRDEHLLNRWLQNVLYLKTCNLQRVFMCHADSFCGTEEINAFLQSQIDKYDKPIAKLANLMESLAEKPLSAYTIADRYYARLPKGLAAEPDNIRGRRVSIIFCYLEFLTEQGFLTRIDDQGVYRYCMQKGSTLVLPSQLTLES
ncbi:MAG: MBL fold metallo-hydrolase [Eggerthellales bacterium]|nr:MBL fold metallo-hydrolase [Eggerthellales bacterium]